MLDFERLTKMEMVLLRQKSWWWGLKCRRWEQTNIWLLLTWMETEGFNLAVRQKLKFIHAKKTFPFLSVIHHTNLSRNKMTFSFPEPLGCSDRRRNRNKRRLETRIRSQDWGEVRETIFAHLVSLCLVTPFVYFFVLFCLSIRCQFLLTPMTEFAV